MIYADGRSPLSAHGFQMRKEHAFHLALFPRPTRRKKRNGFASFIQAAKQTLTVKGHPKSLHHRSTTEEPAFTIIYCLT